MDHSSRGDAKQQDDHFQQQIMDLFSHRYEHSRTMSTLLASLQLNIGLEL